jgi:hypothetical protein
VAKEVSAEEKEFVNTGLKAGTPRTELYLTLMLARLADRPIKEVRDEHFMVVAGIQEGFRRLSENFEKDVTDSVFDTRDGPAGGMGFSEN